MFCKTKKKKRKKRKSWSQILAVLVIIFGFIISQEGVIIIRECIHYGFTATAAYITALIGLAQTVMGVGLTSYISLCKTDHKGADGEGITFASAKAKNFIEEDIEEEPTI